MSEDTALSITHREEHVEWKIEKFISLSKEVDYCIVSPTFSLTHSNWYLRMYPNGQIRIKTQGWVGLYLCKKRSAEECSVACSIRIGKNGGSEFRRTKRNFKMEANRWGFKYLERSTLESSKDILDSDGSLTVFCTVRIENTKEVESQTTSPSYDIATLSKDLKQLYLNGQHADISITVEGKEFNAHKCILTSRSKVFAAMFQNDFEEKNSGTVKIDDSDQESFEQFLIHLYTGSLDVVNADNAISLYMTSEKYDMSELKKECTWVMAQNLTVDSFCDVLRLATMHDEDNLLTDATTFFINNLKAILLTTKWQEFLAENPTLGNELFLKTLDNPEKE